MSELERERDFYRRQADELGGQLLRLKETLTQVSREARRHSATATLVRALYRQVGEVPAPGELADRFLALLLERLPLDRAALLRLGPDGRLEVLHALGCAEGFGAALGRLPPLEPPCPEAALPEAYAARLRELAGLAAMLWACHPRSGTVLLLGNSTGRLPVVSLDSTDRKIAEAALDAYVGICDLLATQAALRTSEANYRAIFDNVNDAIAVLDPESGRLLDANPRMEEMFGYSGAELRHLSVHDLGAMEAGLTREQAGRHAELALRGWPQLVEFRARHRDGSPLWVELNLRTAEIGGGPCLLAVLRDISRRKQVEEQIRHDAFHDTLTGLPNRALILDRVGLALSRAERDPGYRFALLYLDLDRFKVINDSLGHGVGDQLLVALAERLREEMRPGDTIARLGGDEFLVLLDNLQRTEDILWIAERIQAAICRPFLVQEREVHTSAGIGIAVSEGGYRRPEEMLRDADIAMYQAKSQGTGQAQLFRATMHRQAMERLQLEEELRRAVEGDELRLWYQPVVELESGRLTGFEALVRWLHPERGLVMPGGFIPLAEETGLIIPLGAWVLRRACRDLAAWQRDGFGDFSLSVNLSRAQVAQPGLVQTVRTILDESGCDPGRLVLEITESAIMANALQARETLERLRALGPRLSMDDFGTGYSSLSYLHQFPIDVLKIDRSFVQRLEQGEDGEQMVATIITLGHSLGMTVVAEGVETSGQLAVLARLGCEYVQGFLYSQAVPPDQAGELLRAGVMSPAPAGAPESPGG